MRYIDTSDIETRLQSELYAVYFPTDLDFESFYELAMSEVKSYLINSNLDVSKIFAVPDVYSDLVSYTVGQRVAFNGQVWECQKDSYLILPQLGEYWKLTYWKHAKLVAIIVDIMIYHASLKVAINEISIARETAYNNAIKFLKDIAAGKIAIELPRIENAEKPNMPFFGGQKLENITY